MLLFNNFQTSRIFWKKNKNKNVQYAILVHLTFLVLTFLLPFLKNWSNKLNFYWHWCFLNYLLQNPKYISKLKPHSRQKFHNQFEPILSNKNCMFSSTQTGRLSMTVLAASLSKRFLCSCPKSDPYAIPTQYSLNVRRHFFCLFVQYNTYGHEDQCRRTLGIVLSVTCIISEVPLWELLPAINKCLMSGSFVHIIVY